MFGCNRQIPQIVNLLNINDQKNDISIRKVSNLFNWTCVRSRKLSSALIRVAFHGLKTIIKIS